jgi:16S rRNA pseudouridine516 synthase
VSLVRLLANLGYGSRREVEAWIRRGRVTNAEGIALNAKSRVAHDGVRVDGEPLDPPPPLVILLHKPAGFTCSRDDPGRLIYELLPERFNRRNPALSSVGRLDKETTGLLVITDDGTLLHQLTHPKSHRTKTYDVVLDRPLRGDEAAIFASGTLMLHGESKPLLPAVLTADDSHRARVVVREGRYHQIRRMFAACGNHVVALHRCAIGPLELPGDLLAGSWRLASPVEAELLRAP